MQAASGDEWLDAGQLSDLVDQRDEGLALPYDVRRKKWNIRPLAKNNAQRLVEDSSSGFPQDLPRRAIRAMQAVSDDERLDVGQVSDLMDQRDGVLALRRMAAPL